MGVALQDLDCVAMGDVVEADAVGCEDLIAHFDAVLFCKTARIQSEEKMYDRHDKPEVKPTIKSVPF